MNKPLFVTGIGTGVGKTIVSAILTEQLKADYWKPVQAGDLGFSDRDRVASLITNEQTAFHPETYRFQMAASPHKAALFENMAMQQTDFTLPFTENQLIIEGAGGLMVPLSENLRMIDLIRQFDSAAILVVRNYLGCINHTLLSMEALLNRNIPLRAVILNGDMDDATENILHNYSPLGTVFARVPEFTSFSQQSILACPALLSAQPI
jgi:dethiobiotin synthetase